MITVRIGKKNGVYRAVTEGHAGVSPGNDPVCAFVTGLMFALVGSIENQTESGKKRVKIEKGLMDIRYVPGSKEDDAVAAVIYNTVMIGLLQVQENYPNNVIVEV